MYVGSGGLSTTGVMRGPPTYIARGWPTPVDVSCVGTWLSVVTCHFDVCRCEMRGRLVTGGRSHVDMAVITVNSDYTHCVEHLMVNSQGVGTEDG